MATEASLEFVLGETWEIPFELNDASGDDLDLTAGSVKFRLSRRGVLQLELTTAGGDISVESPSMGNGSISVSPDDQLNLYPGVFDFEIRATLSDGRVTTQAYGSLTLLRTLFN